MAKKTYKTFYLKGLQLLLLDEKNQTIEVNFRKGIQIDSTAKFTTDDEKIQKALESCSGFNRDFYIEAVRENPTETPVEAPKAKEGTTAEEVAAPDGKRTVKVADKAEAVEWLKENYPEKEYTSVKLRAKAAFDAACQECGVEFEMANA